MAKENKQEQKIIKILYNICKCMIVNIFLVIIYLYILNLYIIEKNSDLNNFLKYC
ncbi:hypothetical protein CNEO3_10115 [Clostridium neonatale]|uniref:Uncharacterized protein n=1 Tax=Clostridium neonatale TaxID=137838 RepID=A0AA86MMK6_9CLOT|nr:hypothetical protein CNEO_40991 [Clostridium neonatale]CAI3547077.1 hypothetical protein CNEO4_280036 [Clostridium neonatale]CAI3547239.1 hypothetical protein CNEO4_1440077 [Clostridium neonatale]CAI3561460.1 hypothetical protein CNEO3_100071 [Clostridium neonatale]CAI3563901.1 hypothetical protein CNEO4_1260015 [Clostridium neonatale]